jgi:hypothetical protein
VLVSTIVAAAASAATMAALYRPELDPSRVYYGTDTRACGLLLGSALALAAPRWRWKARLRDGLGGLALIGLAVLCLSLGEYEPALYRGGFALVGALSLMVIFVSEGWLGTHVLEWAPLRWLGVRSYGVYLWHWPVFMLTRPGVDVFLDGWVVFLARLLIVGLLADFSYRCVERPWRTGAPRLRWAGVAGGVLVGLSVLGGSVAAAKPPQRPAYLPTDAIDTWSDFDVPTTDVEVAQSAPETPTEIVSPTPVAPMRVTAIGDSVMLGSVGGLQATIDGIEVDAAISRQVSACIDTLRTRAAAGQLGDVVVVHIGNNGTFTTTQFDEIMDLLAAVKRVVIVNLRVPRAWETANNAVLADGVARYPNAVLVDWHAASSQHPELFWSDGMHLRPEGALVYAQLIAAQVSSMQ